MPYNFCNHDIFIFLKIVIIFKVEKVIAPPCTSRARVCVRVCACVRACVRARVRACVRVQDVLF